jgi:AsmA-like C-terminal region
VVRLRDSRNGNTLALSDVNGKLTMSDSMKLDLSLLQNGSLTTLAADIENANRFFSDGSPADITLASREKLLSFSGRAQFSKALSLDGQMTLEGAEVQTLMTWLGMPLEFLRGAGEIKLTSGISTQGLVASLSSITAQVGGTDLSGSATFQPGTDRIAITADISTPSLALLPKSNLLAKPWSETPYPLADLTTFDADIRVKTENLILREQGWGPTETSLKIAGGVADLVVSNMNTTLKLNSKLAAKLIDLDVNLQTKSAEAKTLFGGLLGFDQMSGPVDIALKAKANGANLAAFVSTLKGKVTIEAAKANLSGTDIAARMATPGEGWQAGTSTFGTTIEAQINDGIVAFTKADMTLPGGGKKLSGEIDLLRQAFDLRITPKGKVQSIKGPWTRPLFAAEAGTAPQLRPVATPAN